MLAQQQVQTSKFVDSLFPAGKINTLSHSGMNRFRRGEKIFLPGDPSDCVYFVITGKVKIGIVNEEQKSITKAILGVGEVFGEMALTGEAVRRDSATALEDTMIRTLSSADMLLLLQGRPELTMYLMQLIAARQVEAERRLESLVFRDSRSRIVECLVTMTDQKAQRVGFEWVLRNPVTHQEIANMTATSRQTVTTTLNDLRAMKLLKFNRKQLLIRDLDGLRAQIRA